MQESKPKMKADAVTRYESDRPRVVFDNKEDALRDSLQYRIEQHFEAFCHIQEFKENFALHIRLHPEEIWEILTAYMVRRNEI